MEETKTYRRYEFLDRESYKDMLAAIVSARQSANIKANQEQVVIELDFAPGVSPNVVSAADDYAAKLNAEISTERPEDAPSPDILKEIAAKDAEIATLAESLNNANKAKAYAEQDRDQYNRWWVESREKVDRISEQVAAIAVLMKAIC